MSDDCLAPPGFSIHDNYVYAYTVDCAGKALMLYTEFRDREPYEFTDIVFRGVLAHHFQYVLQGNVLNDVSEVDIETFILENAELFHQSWRYGWPSHKYEGELDRLLISLKADSIRAFSVNSSLGLCGWVLARGMDVTSRREAAVFGAPS